MCPPGQGPISPFKRETGPRIAIDRAPAVQPAVCAPIGGASPSLRYPALRPSRSRDMQAISSGLCPGKVVGSIKVHGRRLPRLPVRASSKDASKQDTVTGVVFKPFEEARMIIRRPRAEIGGLGGTLGFAAAPAPPPPDLPAAGTVRAHPPQTANAAASLPQVAPVLATTAKTAAGGEADAKASFARSTTFSSQAEAAINEQANIEYNIR